MIEKNLELIKKNIEQFSRGQQVRVLGATKKQSLLKIQTAIRLGLNNIGENYLQEALLKQATLKNFSVSWHFIGQIQSKKIKEIVGSFEFIHSVSRTKEIESINKAAMELKKVQKIFLQVNIAKEINKNGLFAEDLEAVLAFLNQCENVHCLGIMSMPPLANKPEDSRYYFKQTRNLLVKHQKNCHTWSRGGLLSMGTSSDYTVALEEGSHFIRLGTNLFGPRD